MTDLIGTMFGHYRITEKIGFGGVAAVYKAFDTYLEQEVAIKVITIPQQKSDGFLPRFTREAESLAKLSHPHMTDLYDFGEQDGKLYLVMEYVKGTDLAEKLGKPISYQDSIKMLLPIAQALAYVHQHHVIHRDVKPENILISDLGQILLSDFGVVKLLGCDQPNLTQGEVGLAGPEYMAPEQAQGQDVDGRVDIYALGVVFYQMLTGRTPYQADTPMAVLWKQVTEPLRLPCEIVKDLPEPVQQVVCKALKKRPEDRYQTMTELANEMEQLLQLEQDDGALRALGRDSQAIYTDRKVEIFPTITVSGELSKAAPTIIASDIRNGNQKEKKNKNWAIWLITGSLMMMVIICGMAIILSGALDSVKGLLQVDLPGNFLNLVNTPTEEVANSLLESAQVEELFQCAEEFSPVIIDLAPEMSPIFCDTFDQNQGWDLSPYEDDLVQVETVIENGVIRFDLSSKQPMLYWVILPIESGFDDFAISVDVRRLSGEKYTDMGINFRSRMDGHDYYSWMITDQVRESGFLVYQSPKWMALQNFTSSDAILPNQWNRLSLVARGKQFDFYINGIFQNTIKNDLLSTGLVSLSMDVNEVDGHAVFEFDHLVVLAP